MNQISNLQPGRVSFHGIIETVRDKKSMQFIVVRDFSGKIQLTVEKENIQKLLRFFHIF